MCEHNIFSRWSNVQQLKSDWPEEEENILFLLTFNIVAHAIEYTSIEKLAL